MTHPMSGKALAAGADPTPIPAASALPLSVPTGDPVTLFITWTTYGTWLPGDARGWRKWKVGQQQPQPLLENWCRQRMKEEPLILNESQRKEVEDVIRRHASIRGWEMHAVSVRSNHVHVVVTFVPNVGGKALAAGRAVKNVRDQFKANGTTALRRMQNPVTHKKVWTKGGDTEIIDTDDELERVVIYVTEAQDRMDRGK